MVGWVLVVGLGSAQAGEGGPMLGIGAGVGGPGTVRMLNGGTTMSAPPLPYTSLRWFIGSSFILEPDLTWLRSSGWLDEEDLDRSSDELVPSALYSEYSYLSAGLTAKWLIPVGDELAVYPMVGGAWEREQLWVWSDSELRSEAVVTESKVASGWIVGGGLGTMIWLRSQQLSLSAELFLAQYGAVQVTQEQYLLDDETGDRTLDNVKDYDLDGLRVAPDGRLAVHLYF